MPLCGSPHVDALKTSSSLIMNDDEGRHAEVKFIYETSENQLYRGQQVCRSTQPLEITGERCFRSDTQSFRNSPRSDYDTVGLNEGTENLISTKMNAVSEITLAEDSPVMSRGRKKYIQDACVKYSANENEPLISGENDEFNSDRKHISIIMADSLDNDLPLNGTTPTSSTLDNPLSMPLHHSRSAVQETAITSTDSHAALNEDKVNTRCSPVSDLNTSSHFQQSERDTSTPHYFDEFEHIPNTAEPIQAIIPSPENTTSYPGCYNNNTSLQFSQQPASAHQHQSYSLRSYSPTPSFEQIQHSGGSDTSYVVTPHILTSQPATEVSCGTQNNWCLSGIKTNVSGTGNFDLQTHSYDHGSVTDFGGSLSEKPLKKHSKSSPSAGNTTPLQVFVPKFGITAQEKHSRRRNNANMSTVSCLHKSVLNYASHSQCAPHSGSAHVAKCQDTSPLTVAAPKSNSYINPVVDGGYASSANQQPIILTCAEQPNFRNRQCLYTCNHGCSLHLTKFNKNQSIHNNQSIDDKSELNRQINLGQITDHALLASSYNRGFVAVELEPPFSQASASLQPNPQTITVSDLSNTGKTECEFPPNHVSTQNHLSYSTSNPQCLHEHIAKSTTNLHSHGLSCIHWGDPHAAHRQCPSTLTTNINSSARNTSDHPEYFDTISPCPVHSSVLDIDIDTSNVRTEVNGHQAEGVSGDFPANIAECREHLLASTVNQIGSSVPSSIDGEHMENKDGSLQRSNTSELGLLKMNWEASPGNFYTDRDVPNYSYLCIVATVLNPVFGLAAFLCNHYARKNYRLHRRTKANNLYFATITISNVAIFLTLVGASLLITHVVVVHSDTNSPAATTPPAHFCDGRFFDHEDTLKTFFNIDWSLYCEVTKNEKVMEALKRFWLEDIHNKQKCNDPKPMCKDGNGTHPAQLNNDTTLNGSTYNVFANSNILEGVFTPSNMEIPERHGSFGATAVPQLPKPVHESIFSHKAVINSNDDPVVPPGLEGEYKKYLEGDKLANPSEVNPFLRRSELSSNLTLQPLVSLDNIETSTIGIK